jgi:hypothetical protein
MYTSTDIPDWCLAEVLGQCFEESKFRGPTSDQIVKMYEKSPVSRIDRVKAPTLIALGMADLRVPPSQGKSFRKKFFSWCMHIIMTAFELLFVLTPLFLSILCLCLERRNRQTDDKRNGMVSQSEKLRRTDQTFTIPV